MTLDFAIFGVARSGTSAFARALNLHPNLFCGIEFFEHNYNFTGVNVAEAFRTTAGARDREVLEAKLATSPKILYGDKVPGYLNRLDSLVEQCPSIRLI